MNTKVFDLIMGVINPTINYGAGSVALTPIKQSDEKDKIDRIASNNVEISRTDWDAFETSWDFKRHPLV